VLLPRSGASVVDPGELAEFDRSSPDLDGTAGLIGSMT